MYLSVFSLDNLLVSSILECLFGAADGEAKCSGMSTATVDYKLYECSDRELKFQHKPFCKGAPPPYIIRLDIFRKNKKLPALRIEARFMP